LLLTLLSARRRGLRGRRRKRREVEEREDRQELRREARTLPQVQLVRGVGCEEQEKTWTVV